MLTIGNAASALPTTDLDHHSIEGDQSTYGEELEVAIRRGFFDAYVPTLDAEYVEREGANRHNGEALASIDITKRLSYTGVRKTKSTNETGGETYRQSLETLCAFPLSVCLVRRV